MTTRHFFKTATPNVVDGSTQIAAGSISSAEVDSSIATQAALDTAIDGLTPKGSARGYFPFSQLSSVYMSYVSGATKRLVATLNITFNELQAGGLTDYSVGERVLLNAVGLDSKYSGLYEIVVLGATNTAATGTLTANAAAGITEFDTFTVSDGTNSKTFQFVETGHTVTSPAYVMVEYSPSATAPQVALAIEAAFATAFGLAVSGSAKINDVDLTNVALASGATGNQPITQTGTSLAAISGMSGGADDGTPFQLARTANANQSSELIYGNYVMITDGTYVDQVYYQSTPSNPDVDVDSIIFAHWGETYSAGDGIEILGTTVSAAFETGSPLMFSLSNKLDINLTGSLALYNNLAMLDVHPSSSTQAGVITPTQFKDLSRTVAASVEPAMVTTTGSGYVDVAIPVTPLNTVVLLTVSMQSVSNASSSGPSGKWCVTHAKFALRRGGAGDSVLIGNTVHIFKQGDAAGIDGLYVEGLTGTAGADQLRIYGVSTFNIDHHVVITAQYLPNPVSA